jgi:hypothetical protein
MKYKIILAFGILLVAAILIDSGQNAFSNANGAPAGVSGSPADGNTCAASGCHTGSAVTAVNNWVSSNIPAAGYTPGHSYTITAKAVKIGKLRFGFEVSPQDLIGNTLGTLSPANNKTSVTTPGYITHTKLGNSGTDSVVWTFNWVAPAYGTGTLTFYGAFNCANNDGTVAGDLIYTSTLTVKEAPSPGVDAGIVSVVTPHLFFCSPTVAPVVTIHNFGTTTLNSANIQYHLDAAPVQNFSWTGNLATDSSAQVTLPVMTPGLGTHTFTAATNQPNATADTILVNDGTTVSFLSDQNAIALPFHEGFDSAQFVPAGWLIDNPDNDTTWRYSSAHFAGTGSAFMDNYNYRNIGRKDAMISPAIDLSAVSNPVLTFQLAYRLYTDPTSAVTGSDTLQIEVSTDCGATWHQVYKKFGAPLTTCTPPFSHTAFVPTAAQWRFENIDLGAYKSAHSAIFRFVNITDYENNVMNSNGIESHEAGRLRLELFPNPVSDRLQVDCMLPTSQALNINLFDMHGKQVALLLSDDNHGAGKFSKSFYLKNYPAGVYLLQVQTGARSETKRFVIAH